MERGELQKILNGLADNELSAIHEFSNQVRNILGNTLLEIKLFGSKSKNSSSDDSDIDILIITEGLKAEQKEKIYKLATDLNLFNDVLIVPIIMESKYYYSPLFQESHFYKITQKEGILL